MNSQCHIYIISHIEDRINIAPVKIGITKSLGGRIAAIQTANFCPVVVAYSFKLSSRDLALRIEKEVHDELHEHRLHGEWFDVSPFYALEMLCAVVFNTLEEETRPDDVQKALIESGAIDHLKTVNDFYRGSTN